MALKGKTFAKRFLSAVAGAVMTLGCVIPNGVRLAAAATSYPVTIRCYDTDGTTLRELSEDVNKYNYYVLTSFAAAGGSDDVIGWQVMNMSKNQAEQTLDFTRVMTCNEAHEKTGETEYNDEIYRVTNVRVYRSVNKDQNIPSDNFYNIAQAETDVVDTIPGYRFTRTMGAASTEVGIILSDIEYELRVNAPADLNTTLDNHLYIRVTAPHSTTPTTYYSFPAIFTNGVLSGADSVTEPDGSITNTIKVQANGAGSWQKENGEATASLLGGSEQTIAEIVYAKEALAIEKINKGDECAAIENGGTVAGLKAVYENDYPAQPITGDATVANKITLTSVSATKDYTYRSILGDTIDIGLLANTWEKVIHAQTNFAVNNYATTDGGNVDQDLNRGYGGKIYVAYFVTLDGEKHVLDILTKDAEGNKGKLNIGGSHCGDVDAYLDPSNAALTDSGRIKEILDKDGNPIYSNGGWVTIHEMDASDIQKIVNSMIDQTISISNELAAHEATGVDAYVINNNKMYLDTTLFPADATIYVDGDKLNEIVQKYDPNNTRLLGESDGLHIKKLPNQVIVFNFKTTESLKLGTPSVTVVKPDGEVEYKKFAETDSNETNLAIDQDVTRTIVWNLNSVKDAHIGTTTGIVLNPNRDSVTTLDGTASGWMHTAGYFTNPGGEWHFVYTEVGKSIGAAYFVDLHKVDAEGNPLANAVLAIDKYDGTNFVPYKTLKTTGSKSDEIQLAAGRYRIRETAAPEGYSVNNDTVYYLEIKETGKYYYFPSDGAIEKEIPKHRQDEEHDDSVCEIKVTLYSDETFTTEIASTEYTTLEVNANDYQDDYGDVYHFTVDSTGVITAIEKNGTAVPDSELDAEKAKFTVIKADKLSGIGSVCYDGTEIQPQDNVYVVNGARYSIRLKPGGKEIDSITVPASDYTYNMWGGKMYFMLTGGNQLAYYKDTWSVGAAPTETVTLAADGTAELTYGGIKQKIKVTQGAMGISKIEILDEAGHFTVGASNYVIVEDGSLLYPVLNVTERLGEEAKLSITNTPALFVKKIDKDTTAELAGATLKLISE